MKIKIGMATAVIAVAAASFGLFSPADAGPGTGNTFTVIKVVDGPVPAGAVFEVEVQCLLPVLESSGAELVPVTTLSFDETGAPIPAGSNSLSVGFFENCTATETVTNGAAVTYACAVTSDGGGGGGAVDESEVVPIIPAACDGDQTVVFGSTIGDTGTITVTNTFPEPPIVCDGDDPVSSDEGTGVGCETPDIPDVEPDDEVLDDDVVAATPPFTG